MTEDEFSGLAQEIVTKQNIKALYRKLTPYFEQVERLASDARHVHDLWLEGELTRLDGMGQLDLSLRKLGH